MNVSLQNCAGDTSELLSLIKMCFSPLPWTNLVEPSTLRGRELHEAQVNAEDTKPAHVHIHMRWCLQVYNEVTVTYLA